MLLYDGQSAIDWFYDALLTADEMMEREEYAHIFDGPAVLYDNGDGKVYGWETLEALCGKWAVPFSDDAASAFLALVEAMNNPLPQVTPEELKKVSDTATAAQQAAEKAQAQAEQAAAGSNPELATFATMQLMSLAPTMSDADVLSIPSLFPEWKAGVAYEAKQVIKYEGELYRIAQKHTAQEQHKPGAGTESLYTHIVQSGGYDVWQQPTGAHDAYSKGTRVWYPTANSTLYESLIDANTYSPEAYPAGWKKVTE